MDERVAFFKLAVGADVVAPAPATASIPERPSAVATPSRGAAAPKQQPAAPAKQAVAGGNSGGPVRRMQAALATAVNQDPDWKEF